MPAPQDLRATGDRIEQLLEELRSTTDPRTYARIEEALRLVTDLYGGGLERIVAIVRDRDPTLIEELVADDLTASLLLVHGLHPVSLPSRVEGALASVRPLLASHGGDVELLDLDETAGAVLVRLLGSCDGCPSSAVTLQMAVEQAIIAAAPEIGRVDLETPEPKAPDIPVALGTKPDAHAGSSVPVYDSCPAEMAAP
jgi:Fe-S cluster biogenesis protein NfuA